MRTDSVLGKLKTEEQEVSGITIPETILDLDLKKILAKFEATYQVRLPRRVVAVDFGTKGDLYVRFRHVPKPIGVATEDGLAVLFYEDGDDIVGLELLNVERFT